MLAPSNASLDPQADSVSTSSSATNESVVANSGYRQPPPTGGRHRRSEARESMARDSDATWGWRFCGQLEEKEMNTGNAFQGV